MLIDSHCHLNFNAFDPDRFDVVARAKAEGVAAFINPATTVEDSRQIVALSAEIPEVYAAVGVHPTEAGAWDESTLEQLRHLAGQPKVAAIGEIGLDYYWDAAPRPAQRQVFEQQLTLARDLNLPVIVHQREAAADTMSILRQWAKGGQHPGLVLHAFSGDQAMAEEATSLGFYIGLAGPVTFKNARDLPAIVTALPIDCLLVETDAPFLSPHPFRGKRNEPARVKLVAERVAALRNVSLVDLSRQLTENTLTLFKSIKIW
jgi:TatD DNase family protein